MRTRFHDVCEISPIVLNLWVFSGRRAVRDGIDAADIAEAWDGEDPKENIVELILAVAAQSSENDDAVLRGELAELKMSALRQRAHAAGADQNAIDVAEDSDDPRGAFVALLVELTFEVKKEVWHDGLAGANSAHEETNPTRSEQPAVHPGGVNSSGKAPVVAAGGTRRNLTLLVTSPINF